MTEQEYLEQLNICTDDGKGEDERLEAAVILAARVLFNLERIADAMANPSSLI
jgi:hypothetical protein